MHVECKIALPHYGHWQQRIQTSALSSDLDVHTWACSWKVRLKEIGEEMEVEEEAEEEEEGEEEEEEKAEEKEEEEEVEELDDMR